MHYFRLLDDVESPGRWSLKSPHDAHGNLLSADSFTVARRVSVATPLKIPVRRHGIELDFTFGAFDMPVVNSRVLAFLGELVPTAFQHFSAQIEGHLGVYAVVNFLETRNCVDESRSEFLKWAETDGRPDKEGQYRQITRLRIDPALAAGLDVFRLEGWKIALIVSDSIKRALTAEKITGVQFVSVS